MAKKTISDLIMEYFQAHPNVELRHAPVVDWVEEQYIALYGIEKKPRDIWRATRKLYEKGKLIQVKKGVYKYDPDAVKDVELFDFPPQVKEQIFKRDNYRCVVCGRGRENGIEIVADHKKSKSRGGTNSVENGQTLCTQHNLLKKNYSGTETGKRYFIQIYEDAIASKDERMIKFCQDIFDVYEKHDMNHHIPRPNE
jgi:hypothetical protein